MGLSVVLHPIFCVNIVAICAKVHKGCLGTQRRIVVLSGRDNEVVGSFLGVSPGSILKMQTNLAGTEARQAWHSSNGLSSVFSVSYLKCRCSDLRYVLDRPAACVGQMATYLKQTTVRQHFLLTAKLATVSFVSTVSCSIRHIPDHVSSYNESATPQHDRSRGWMDVIIP